MIDQEIMQGLWLGDSRDSIFQGQYDAVLTLGPAGAVRFENGPKHGLKHRHADYPEDNDHEARLAAWCVAQWCSGHTVCVRAEPLLNGQRIVARMMLILGAQADDVDKLFTQHNGAAA